MLGLVRRAVLPLSRRGAGEAMLGGVVVLRRLAAIGAEVPGDRERTRARLGSLGHDLIGPKIALHEGRTLKPAGAVEPARIAAV
jgi:hypothetical protein